MNKLSVIAACIVLATGCMFQKPDYLTMIPPEKLQSVMQHEDIFLIDVHTPEQRHIKGTDAFIPYNDIENNKNKLPADKNTAIYIYCAGGPMGNAAARTLNELGYQKLFNLEGGSDAWKKAGFAFE